MKKKKIFYVNYSPYENSGHILEFLAKNFEYVFLFSIGFHDLGEKRSSNRLVVYKNGRRLFQKLHFHLKTPKNLEYMFVPFRSLINLFQIFLLGRSLRKKYGKIDVFFSVNAFVAWAGLVLKGFGLIDKTVFWVWDYYPLIHKNPIVLAMRWLYWHFDRVAMYSSKVIFLNQRLAGLNMRSKIIGKGVEFSVVPIGTNTLKRRKRYSNVNTSLDICFLGVLKKSQGLDFILEAEIDLIKRIPNIMLHIIGGGPDLEYYKNKFKNSKLKYKFYGKLSDPAVDRVMVKSAVGLATYVPDRSNVSYFGDPSKVKKYLSLGVPVVTTDVFDFSKMISHHKAGFVVKYGDVSSFVNAIKKINLNYKKYSDRALKLSKEYEYTKIYKQMFKFK